jgi:hypothetical protein
MYNGLVQDPARYTIVDSTLTLLNTAPLIAGANVEVRYFDFFSLPGSSSGGGGESYSFQGSVSGYTSGGGNPGQVNTIDKFSFTADANASDVGDLTTSTHSLAGQSSSTNGYTSGGRNPLDPINIISKFPFSTDSNATDVGDLTVARQGLVGQSSSENGYASGGNAPPTQNVIDKFPFATDGNATDVGDLSVGGTSMASQSSATDGYTSGGYGRGNVIDKFPFAANANATDVGDLTQSRYSIAGQSSTVSGYTSGGINITPPTAIRYNTVDKFPFATNANATDVGDLTETKGQHAGQSSISNGYVTGGISPSVSNLNVIEKFPFASNSNAADVGDLTQGRRESPAGQQV